MFKLNDKLFNMFKEFTKRFSKLEKEVGKDVGLNSSETKVIACLDANNELTHTELGELCNADKAAMSRLLNKMQEKELIESNYNNSNKKTLHSRLTESGKRFAQKIKALYEKYKDKYFGKLSENESNLLMSIFNKMFIKTKG